DQKSYFNWAVDHYQIPFLKGLFLEQNLMTKTQWNEIKDLFDWTEEILPVAFWNKTVFIGCVELPKREIEVLGFNTRFVLTSCQSLRVMWKFVQSLSHFIEKEVTRSIEINKLNLEQANVSPDIPSQKPLNKPASADLVSTQQAVSPDMPSQKPLDKPVSAEPVLSQQAVSPDMPSQKPLDKPVSAEPLMNLEKHADFPEGEEERVTEDNNTFPGRAPAEDNVLVMKNFNKENKQATSKKPADNISLEENTKFTFFDTVDKTLTHFYNSYNYEELWKYTKSFYCTSLVLRVKGEKVYPISWTGQVKLKKTEDIFVDLNDYSLFKIVKKGYSYNGFVVDNPVNKKFFSQIGWQEYPKHVTAIPIKDSENNLVSVFVGLSVEPISRGKVQQIEENVLKFFQNGNGHKTSKAA
ncbi:MAG: hypothetical protein OXJ52_00140, partial [Oligoflexia bacterium]|nr:hypothetical protein [Oligoflexia bacterium]